MIPCEFCGIQLEEEILFHHQVLNRTGSGGHIPLFEDGPSPRGSCDTFQEFRELLLAQNSSHKALGSM